MNPNANREGWFGNHTNMGPRPNANYRYAPYPNQSGYPHSYLNPSDAQQIGGQYGYRPYNRSPVNQQYQQNRQFNYNQAQMYNQNPNGNFSPGFQPNYNNRFQNRPPNGNNGYQARGHFSPGRNHNNQKSGKPKIDKRDLPENNKFYCEVCDRGFKTDEKYQEHCQGHVTCHVDGCKFTAAEKLVEIHFRNFHATGIDKKVSKLETPEDIQKYINDRKKNFPTKGNIEVKSKVQDEKFKRGAPLNTQKFGRLNKNRTKEQNIRNQPLLDSVKNEKGEENIEEGELDEESLQTPENGPETDTNNKFRMRKRENSRKNKNGQFSQKVQATKNRNKEPTLLQKLLADEIRHERNIILQCVRYVVQKNFFERRAEESPKINN